MRRLSDDTIKRLYEKQLHSRRAAGSAAISDWPANQKPMLQDFDLPDGFDVRGFEHKGDALRRANAEFILTFIAVISLGYSVSRAHTGDGVIAIFGGAIFMAFAIVISFSIIGGWSLTYGAIELVFGRISDRRKLARFKLALEKWEYFNLITKEGFWKQLRGQDLEQATALLFRERGWSVNTTPVTGDGGVDLILKSGDEELWCQCKGYAKPVSVAAVREIAGVCSASAAKPVLIVVNGITKPARAEADRYAVRVWDSEDLASFARPSVCLRTS